jgi:hypothetical protein
MIAIAIASRDLGERDDGGIGWKREQPVRNLARARRVGMNCRLRCYVRLAVQIELENAGNHDDGLGPISILEHRESKRFRAADEQAAAKVPLVLNDPVAAAVLTDKEELVS